MPQFTHFDTAGQAHMVDVSSKAETQRIAVASGTIRMQPDTLLMIQAGDAKKGDVLGIARIAAIQASKRTSDLIPLCHPISLTKVGVDFSIEVNTDQPSAEITCTVTAQTIGRTGVEMEALTATSVALLTIYDMCKSVDRGMVIHDVKLLEKSGGKSGPWVNKT